MKRPLRADEARLWAAVTATVRPAPGRARPPVQDDPEGAAPGAARPDAAGAAPPAKPASAKGRPTPPPRPPAPTPPGPFPIEPLRRRRLVRERDAIEARIDLHGLDQDRARAALHDFLRRAHAGGCRAVLVITGKGSLGDGVLRRRAPEWLADPAVRPVIAGVSQADRRHGGAGALYVALKRNPG
jgi:DNA-nicking Smr family endonuclease